MVLNSKIKILIETDIGLVGPNRLRPISIFGEAIETADSSTLH